MKVISDIIHAIKNNKTFFIAGHMKPDGDTIGTGIALASLLKRMGKKVCVYSGEPIPPHMSFLSKASKVKIQVAARVSGKFDCAIILECLDLARMGNLITAEQAGTLINIDHHKSFSNYGDINYIDSQASSSAEQLFNIFKQLKMPILPHEADALYVGLVTDTGKFQQANTTPKSLRMAADLVEAGVVPTRMFGRLYATQSLPSLSLLGLSLSTLKLTPSGKIAYLEVTRKMYKKTNTTAADTEGLINHAMMIPGVVAGVLFRETESNLIKVSMRSIDYFDVNKIAKHFRGGGHKNASGCTFIGNITDAKRIILTYLREAVSCDS